MSVAQNFEKLLNDFFALYHPRQVKKVGALVQEFKGQEVSVLKALCDKYKKAYSVVPGLVDALEVPAPAPVVEAPAQIEEAPEVEETVEEEEAPVAEEENEEPVAEEASEEEVAEEEEEEKE